MPSASNSHALSMLLQKLQGIASLADAERRAIQSLPVHVQALQADQDIGRDGDMPNQCCLVVEGWAVRYKILGDGQRQILSFHVSGDIPDLHSLHIPVMDHSLGALTKATVAFIPHDSLRDVIQRFPGLAALFWRLTLMDAAVSHEWMTGMGRRSAYERLTHLLCELYLKLRAAGLADEHRCHLPMTQGDLADATGLSNVHVNRVLQAMRANGLITLRGHTLVIEKWDELVIVAEFNPLYLHQERRAVG